MLHYVIYTYVISMLRIVQQSFMQLTLRHYGLILKVANIVPLMLPKTMTISPSPVSGHISQNKLYCQKHSTMLYYISLIII